MCPATLSNKAGKWLHAAPRAPPHPRGFISLAEQQPVETANQHAVSKGRLRWQQGARVTPGACCHLVVVLRARRTTSQQTLAPPTLAQTHTRGRSPESHNTHPPLIYVFLHGNPTHAPPLPLVGKQNSKQQQASWICRCCCCCCCCVH